MKTETLFMDISGYRYGAGRYGLQMQSGYSVVDSAVGRRRLIGA
jgi:hypothetical protein